MLDSERILRQHFGQFSKFHLCQQLFAFKDFLTKAILKSSYRVLQESSCLISDMIFDENYFSGYILLTDQISLSGYLYFTKYWAICVL